MVWSCVRGGLAWYQEDPVPAVCKKNCELLLCCWLTPVKNPHLLFQATLDCVALSQAFLQPFLPKSKTHTSHRLELPRVGLCGLLHFLQFTSVLLGWRNPNSVHWKYGWTVPLHYVSPVWYDTAAKSTLSSSNSLSFMLLEYQTVFPPSACLLRFSDLNMNKKFPGVEVGTMPSYVSL